MSAVYMNETKTLLLAITRVVQELYYLKSSIPTLNIADVQSIFSDPEGSRSRCSRLLTVPSTNSATNTGYTSTNYGSAPVIYHPDLSNT